MYFVLNTSTVKKQWHLQPCKQPSKENSKEEGNEEKNEEVVAEKDVQVVAKEELEEVNLGSDS